MRQIVKKSVVAVFIAALFFVIFHAAKEFLFQVLNPNNYKEEISRRLERAIGKKVIIGSASVKFINGIGIKLGPIRIFENKDGKNFFSADSIIAVVRVAPLFKKQILLKKIILNHPVFFENMEFTSEGNSSWEKAVPILAGAAQFQIKNGEWAMRVNQKKEGQLTDPVRFDLVIRKSFVGDAPYVFTLQGRLKYQNREKGKFKLEGEILRLPDEPDPMDIEFNAKINGQNIKETFLSLLYPRISSLAKHLPGSLDFDTAISGIPSQKIKMDGLVEYNTRPGIYAEDSSQRHLAKLKFSACYQDHSLLAEKVDLILDNMKMGGKVEIKNVGGDGSVLNLNWEVDPFPVSLLKKNSFWGRGLPDKAREPLQDFFHSGKIHIQSIHYNGPWNLLSEDQISTILDHLSLRFIVEDVDGFWNAPGGPISFTGGYGQFAWENKRLAMGNVHARVLGAPVEDLRGEFSIGDILRPTDITGKLKLNLAEFPLLLSRMRGLGVTSAAPMEALQDMVSTAAGEVEVDFKVEGEAGALKTSGNVHFTQASFETPYAGITPERINGRLHFDETSLVVEDLTGEAAGIDFSVSGKLLGYWAGTPEFQLDAYLKGNGESMKAVLSKNISNHAAPWLKNLSLSGPVKMKLALKGDPAGGEIDSFLDLTAAGLHYADSLAKEKGKDCSLFVSSRYAKGKPFSLNRYEFSYMGDLLAGEILPADGGTVPSIQLNTKKLQIKNLLDLLSTPYHPSLTGHLAFQLRSSGKKTRNNYSFIQGELQLENFGYHFQGLPVPFKETSGHFQINGEEITVDAFSIKYKDSEVILSGTYEDILSPKYELKLDSPRFQMDDILPRDPITILWIRDFLSGSNRFRRTTGKILINVRDGDFKFLRWGDLTGTLTIKDKAFYLTDAVAPFPGGELHGSGNIGFLSKKGMDFLLNLKVVSAPSREIMAILGPGFDESLTGTFSLSSSISGEGYNWEEVRRSIGGHLALLIKDGRYSKQKLLRGVREIFDLKDSEETQVEEAPKEFQRIGGKFILKGGIAETDNFSILTKTRKTSMMGKLLLGEKALDLSVGVAPWAQADKIVSRIPLVGSILTGGDDKSLLISYYEIKGDMADPKVEALPLKSIGKKFEGIFKGILQTPQDIQELIAPQKNPQP